MRDEKSIKAEADWAKLDKSFTEIVLSFFEGTNAWLEYMEAHLVKELGNGTDPTKLSVETLANLFLTWLDGFAEYQDFYNQNAKYIHDIKKQQRSLEKKFNNDTPPSVAPLH